MKSSLKLTGTVQQVGHYEGEPSSIMVNGEWYSFSKPEYRGAPFDIPEKGDEVEFGYQVSGEKSYIKWIKDLSSPEPEDLEFEDAEGPTGAAFEKEVANTTPLNAPLDKDTLISRQVAIKAAAHLFQGSCATADCLMAAVKFIKFIEGK